MTLRTAFLCRMKLFCPAKAHGWHNHLITDRKLNSEGMQPFSVSKENQM